jgi:hypothetical protein
VDSPARIAPRVAQVRVSRRVSMPSMPTTRRREAVAQVCSARQDDGSGGLADHEPGDLDAVGLGMSASLIP